MFKIDQARQRMPAYLVWEKDGIEGFALPLQWVPFSTTPAARIVQLSILEARSFHLAGPPGDGGGTYVTNKAILKDVFEEQYGKVKLADELDKVAFRMGTLGILIL